MCWEDKIYDKSYRMLSICAGKKFRQELGGYHLFVACSRRCQLEEFGLAFSRIAIHSLMSFARGFGSDLGGDDDGGDCDAPSPLAGSGESTGLARSGGPNSTPSTAATAAKRSREADTEHGFKTPRTSSSSAPAIEETPDTAVAGSSASGSSAAALNGLLAQLRPIIQALKATDPSHVDEDQLASATISHYLLGSFIAGVKAQQEAVRNPPPAETPLNFDDMVHTLSFLDCKNLAFAATVSRHWRNAVPEAVKYRLNHLSGVESDFGSLRGEPPR